MSFQNCNNCQNYAAAVVVSPAYPETPLSVGAYGSEVARMQKYLNTIRKALYAGLNLLAVDGKFGSATKTTVMQYQGYARLPIDGVVGRNTWNAIVTDYNTLASGSANTYPGIPLTNGMTGQDVTHMQRFLNALALIYTAINTQAVDGSYGSSMTNAVQRFQRQFSLVIDGAIGALTWSKIVDVYNASLTANRTKVTTPYSGYALTIGSSGDAVRCAQSYLNGAGASPKLVVDGNFGQKTKDATIAFQAFNGLKPDGVIGSGTWPVLVRAFNLKL